MATDISKQTASAPLEKLNSGMLLRELLTHGLLLGSVLSGALGYITLQLTVCAEFLLVGVISIPLYWSRGIRRHLWDLFKSTFLAAFLMTFIVIGYSIPAEGHTSSPAIVVEALLATAREQLPVAIGYIGLRLLMYFVAALMSPEPRQAWARSTLIPTAATVMTLLAMAFITFLGTPVANIAAAFLPVVTVDRVLGTVAVCIRFALSLLFDRMPKQDLDRIVKNPYVD